MNIENHFKLWPVIVDCKSIALLSLCLFLSSCTNPNVNSGSNQANYPFSGNWQGNGTDSGGNEFTFAAKVSHLGDNKYRVLFLDKLDTLNKPTHILDGILEMGWNVVARPKKNVLFIGIPKHAYFYFVHSYYVQPKNKNIITGLSSYGKDIVVSVEKKNIYATQFHPEKSNPWGLKILQNFIETIKIPN